MGFREITREPNERRGRKEGAGRSSARGPSDSPSSLPRERGEAILQEVEEKRRRVTNLAVDGGNR